MPNSPPPSLRLEHPITFKPDNIWKRYTWNLSSLHSVSAEQGVIWKFGSFAIVALVDENSIGFLYNNVMNGYGVTDAGCSLFIGFLYNYAIPFKFM